MDSARLSQILTLTLAFIVAACGNGSPDGGGSHYASTLRFNGLDEQFGDYWYQGAAEITSYDLEQARYGEIHRGTAVTIFVTEDFSKSKQVKLNDPSTTPDDAVTVLKLNSTRNFETGIYPYSIMTSVFTPIYRDRAPATLKVTASVQEWCGQTFVQMNRIERGYHIQHFSYFENDGDGEDYLYDVILEDELWPALRQNPADLPTGPVKIMPSALYHRLTHSAWQPRQATGQLAEVEDEPGLMEYRLVYDDVPRELIIRFRSAFPYEIEYWEESHGRDRSLITRATRRERLITDYWRHNSPADTVLRRQLGL